MTFILLIVMFILVQFELNREKHQGVRRWTRLSTWLFAFALFFASKVLIGIGVLTLAIALSARLYLPAPRDG